MSEQRHFRFTDEGITNEIADARRESAYFIPIAAPRKKGKGEDQLYFETVIIEKLLDTVGTTCRSSGDARLRVPSQEEFSLFSDFNGIKFEQFIEFYQHKDGVNWANHHTILEQKRLTGRVDARTRWTRTWGCASPKKPLNESW